MYDIKKVKKEYVKLMNDHYYKYVTVPMDDMWEQGIIANGDYYLIGDDIGYFVLNTENTLLQFHIEYKYLKLSKEIFNDILKRFSISTAFVSTYEPMYLILCLDHNLSVETEAYLYIENEDIVLDKPMKEITDSIAIADDMTDILEYHKDKVDIQGDWLIAYLEKLISNDALILFKIEDEIIGTGEIRQSLTNKEFANIGMTVSKDYRKQLIGSYILSTIRMNANKKGLQTICGTDAGNIASQKTITKCGYYPYHRVLKIRFK